MLEAISSTAISAGQAVVRSAETELTTPAAGAVQGSGAVQGGGVVGFDSVLKQVTTDAIGTLKAGEAASILAIQGKESTRRVVEALMSAEQTLQTAVAVRDKVVQAYQEITRMSI
jgi:flagellar hook-basal body complex protein FliE